ncbi:hypothetical protein FA95DRAFT_1559759 [Auriscalpium vulgare]|uniref:Uncharacterized protein n=1 Tax=Auriscalpium vulgare TaxID=40419 RepID=A0ACB8RSL9_9AGAM|nr:hypothetical protein FA95DRAFT_1559759 [Auriscalpium vulgare]
MTVPPAPPARPDSPPSFIAVVDRCDNFRPPLPTPFSPNHTERPALVPFLLSPTTQPPIGLVRAAIVDALQPSPIFITHRPSHEHPRGYISFAAHITTPAARSRAMHSLLAFWRTVRLFPDVIGPTKWRNELYDIFASPFDVLSADTAEGADGAVPKIEPTNYAFSMERAACALFGVVTYGVHMTVYEQDDDGAMRIWVPRRSATKQTWPGFLDNSVAGGIPSSYTPFDALVKEAEEEASISPALTSARAKAEGSVSYFYQADGGWLQPEVEYVYDLRLQPGEIDGGLLPGDTEVEVFKLMPMEEVISRMHAGEFKPNCAVVLLYFLIRHGHVTPDNEPRFLEINTRIHGRFDLDRW